MQMTNAFVAEHGHMGPRLKSRCGSDIQDLAAAADHQLDEQVFENAWR
jgi:hypothetical protein